MNVVSNELGHPVAVSESLGRAREFAYRNLDLADTAKVQWTGTGKLMVDDVWTGWEVKGVDVINGG